AQLVRHMWLAVMAYQHEADALGDLAPDTFRLLKQIASKGATEAAVRLTSDFDRRRADLKPGTILLREWKRCRHRVMVVDEGFVWNGKTYDSLSKIACAITGTRWNGPRFFGLRDKITAAIKTCPRPPSKECAAPSIPGSPPRPASIRTSTRWTPNMMQRRPISAVRLMPAGRSSAHVTTMAVSRAAQPTALPCSGCWPTSKLTRSMSLLSIKSIA